MAIFLFGKVDHRRQADQAFNNGQMPRDFTYIKGVTRVVSHLVNRIPQDNVDGRAPARRYNVGNHRPEDQPCRGALEKELGRTAAGEMLPMQPGGVMKTFADVSDLMHDVGFATETSIEDGIRDFVAWFRDYYKR
jgi:UDP-glucuronate 4-epimerase